MQHSKKNFFLFRKISVISPVSELFIYRNIQNLKFGNVLKDTHNGITKNFFLQCNGLGVKNPNETSRVQYKPTGPQNLQKIQQFKLYITYGEKSISFDKT